MLLIYMSSKGEQALHLKSAYLRTHSNFEHVQRSALPLVTPSEKDEEEDKVRCKFV